MTIPAATSATNYDAGSDDPKQARAQLYTLQQAFEQIRTFVGGANSALTATDAGTLDLDSVDGGTVLIAATAGSPSPVISTIAAPTRGAPWKHLIFEAGIVLEHAAGLLELPGSADIVTAAGDACFIAYDAVESPGVWKVLAYWPAGFRRATQAEAEAGAAAGVWMDALRTAQAIAALAQAGLGAVNIQSFTASGTYTPTSGYTWAIAFVTGGGGGGGGADTASGGGDASGGGGGGGATAVGVLDLTAITSETVTIGAAGTAGNTSGSNGGAGGNSSLGALLTANGGSGGTGSGANVTMDVENNGGAGSSTTGGTALAFTVNGSSGGDSDSTSGYGGGTLWGQGGPAQWFASNSTNTGVAGSVYGSGGSGGTAEDSSGSASAAGGAGAAGVVFILEFK